MEDNQKFHDAALSLAVRAAEYVSDIGDTDDVMVAATRFLAFLRDGRDAATEAFIAASKE